MELAGLEPATSWVRSNQRFPDSPTVFTDQSCLQGFLSPERGRLSRLSTHLRAWRGCIWVARPVVAVSNESARMVRLELRSWRRKGSKLSVLRRQTVQGRCPLGCPRRRQCPEPHAASPRPRRSGRSFEATPRSRSRRCCSRRSANRARGASYPERLPAEVRRGAESPPPVPPRVLAWLDLEAAEQASRFKEVLEPTLRTFRPARLSFDSILASGEGHPAVLDVLGTAVREGALPVEHHLALPA
jgi:hypothetical protein